MEFVIRASYHGWAFSAALPGVACATTRHDGQRAGAGSLGA
jgi:hypothetical protein